MNAICDGMLQTLGHKCTPHYHQLVCHDLIWMGCQLCQSRCYSQVQIQWMKGSILYCELKINCRSWVNPSFNPASVGGCMCMQTSSSLTANRMTWLLVVIMHWTPLFAKAMSSTLFPWFSSWANEWMESPIPQWSTLVHNKGDGSLLSCDKASTSGNWDACQFIAFDSAHIHSADKRICFNNLDICTSNWAISTMINQRSISINGAFADKDCLILQVIASVELMLELSMWIFTMRCGSGDLHHWGIKRVWHALMKTCSRMMWLNNTPQWHETNQGDNMKWLSRSHVLGHDGSFVGQIQKYCFVKSRKEETWINVMALIVKAQQRNWNNVVHAKKSLCERFCREMDDWMMTSHMSNKSWAISCNHHATGPRSQILLPLLTDSDNKQFAFPDGRWVSCFGLEDGCWMCVQACITWKKSKSIWDSSKILWHCACRFCCVGCHCASKGIKDE